MKRRFPSTPKLARLARCLDSILSTLPTKASWLRWSRAKMQVRAEGDAIHPIWRGAVIIGEVTAEPHGRVLLKTAIGSTRVVDMLAGEMLPRIC